jgi:hypothetical protein
LFATLERAIVSCRCNGRVWHLFREQRIFPIMFLKLPCFHFSVLYSKDKDVKLASREPDDFIASNCFYGTRECKNISSVTSRNDFIMQNYSLKKQETIFTVHIKITRKNEKKKKHRITFCPTIFKSYIIICNTMYFTHKNKVNLIHL